MFKEWWTAFQWSVFTGQYKDLSVSFKSIYLATATKKKLEVGGEVMNDFLKSLSHRTNIRLRLYRFFEANSVCCCLAQGFHTQKTALFSYMYSFLFEDLSLAISSFSSTYFRQSIVLQTILYRYIPLDGDKQKVILWSKWTPHQFVAVFAVIQLCLLTQYSQALSIWSKELRTCLWTQRPH